MRTKIVRLLHLVALPVCASPLCALDVLFVGNSFTYGNGNYNAAAITDANGTGQGGLPAAFKKLADEGGRADVRVTIEAVSGQTLTWHLANKAGVLGRAWDVIVLQDHSRRPLAAAGGDQAAFRAAVAGIRDLAAAANPPVRVVLFETWARPDMVPAYYPTLAAMQSELRAAYAGAAADLGLAGPAPVGDAYLAVLESGIAYDPTRGVQAGKINLFVADNYHPSGHGCYLGACVFYAKILGGDPRSLPTGPGSAAAGLGVAASDAVALQALARALVAGEPGAPVILRQPAEAVARPGGAAEFSVAAAGAALGYQWRRNGEVLAGETAATLRIAAARAEDAGRYDVVVTGEAGVTTSDAAALVVTERTAITTWLLDLGPTATGYATPSPDAAGRYWNSLAAASAGAGLSALTARDGTASSGVSVTVASAFSGVNQGGMNAEGAYPATAQRDSFYVTGTGSSGTARRGALRFAGLHPNGEYTLRVFSSRAAVGTRVGRLTASGAAMLEPVFLDAANNTATTASLGPLAPAADGALTITVEPYDAAGAAQEYAYLGVVELVQRAPSPSGFERWAARRGLAAEAAGPAADPDGDGRANLVEYALAGAPELARDASGGLELRAAKAAGAEGVAWAAEVSDDLCVWTPGLATVEDAATVFRVRDDRPEPAAGARFYRLRLTLFP